MTKDELLAEIYNAPFIMPVLMWVSNLDLAQGLCIVQSGEKLTDNEVLTHAAQTCGGRWMIWTIQQENPYQDKKGNWNFILKLVK
jgi:hypothetical protein